MVRASRRHVLRAGTVIGVAGLAGCSGLLGGGAPSTWTARFGNDDFRTFLWGVSPTSDGGYVAAGSQGSADASQDALLLKVDSEGAQAWLETVSGPGWDWLNTAVEADVGVVGVGTMTTETNERGEAVLVALTEDGDVEWERTFSGSGERTYGWGMTATDDGGFLVAGRTGDHSVGWEPLLVKADAEGDEAWRVSPVPDGVTSARLNTVHSTDEGYLLTGDVSEGEDTTPNGYLALVDADGELSWSEQYDTGRLGRAVPVDDGYLVSGVALGPDARTAWLLHVDASGAERWSKTYDHGAGGGISDVTTAAGDLGGGGYYAVGWFMETEGAGETGWLLAVDGDGTKQGEVTWDEAGRSYMSAIERVSGGGYVLAGWKDEDGAESEEETAMAHLRVTTGFDLES